VTRKVSGGGATPATLALQRLGIAFVPHTYLHDPAHRSFGLEAAEALGVEPERVFKTLVASVDGRLAVGVVPVSRTLDLKALAAALGVKKAELADQHEAERKTGYVAGGISPIGQRTALPTVIDASADSHETIFVSGGRRGFELELSPHDLRTATAALKSQISRP